MAATASPHLCLEADFRVTQTDDEQALSSGGGLEVLQPGVNEASRDVQEKPARAAVLLASGLVRLQLQPRARRGLR